MAKVLLVEDEAIVRRVVTRALRQHSSDVVEADSVATADAALPGADACFDVAVLDINLLDLSGWDMLRHLSAHSATTGDGHGRATQHHRAGPPGDRDVHRLANGQSHGRVSTGGRAPETLSHRRVDTTTPTSAVGWSGPGSTLTPRMWRVIAVGGWGTEAEAGRRCNSRRICTIRGDFSGTA